MTRGLLLSGLVMLAVSCTPFGEGFPGGGGSSSSFSSVGSPVPFGSPDLRAHELLLNVAGEAIGASIDANTFAGLDAATVNAMDPTVRVVGDAPARVGIVSLNLASDDGLVLSTRSRSGRSFCISVTGLGLTTFTPPQGGTVDAHGATSVRDCRGRDWVSSP